MNKLGSGFQKGLSCGFVVMLLSGCAATHKSISMTPVQTQQLIARLGTIGVVAAGFVPKAELQTPAKGALAGAGKGAVGGAGMVIDGLSGTQDAASAFVGVFLIPVGAVVGGVGGAIMADSGKIVNEREGILRKNLTDMSVQKTLRDRFLANMVGKTGFRFTPEEEYGPAMEGQISDYLPLAQKGIDTVQEMTVERFGLKGKGKVQPALSLFMVLRVRIVKAGDNQEIFKRTFQYLGEKHKFADWSADNARLFKEELDRCYQTLSENVLKEIYVLNALKVK